MKRLILSALVMSFFMYGCSSNENIGSNMISISIYRLQNSNEKSKPQKLVTEERQFHNRADAKLLTQDILKEMQKKDGYSTEPAIPYGVYVDEIFFYGNSVVVNFSKGYNTLSQIDKSLAASATAMTLTQIQPVDYVKISCADEKYDSSNDFYLSRGNVIINDEEIKLNAFPIEIFYVNRAENRLESVTTTVKTELDTIYANNIYGELMRKPEKEELESPIPSGMMLRSINTNNGVCTLDFIEPADDEVYKLDKLAVYSIVNSLCNNENIRAVKIKIEGKPLSEYGISSFDGEITYNKAY